ncbi:MAG: 4-hydroxythreonine-4-phosphate dehydrogenase PdxA [Isosphaeraceae bacterium]
MRSASESSVAPLLALTMGDVAGIGPEVIARAWVDSPLLDLARPFVIGNAETMRRAVALVGGREKVVRTARPEEVPRSRELIPILEPPSADVSRVAPGRVDPAAGQAAHDYLVTAADLALAGTIDGIVTLPLQKEALRAAGIDHPGHTEILAERCGAARHAMMLYLPPREASRSVGFGVLHATLHMALREIFRHLTFDAILENIWLSDRSFRPLTGGRPPRIAVAALNPHAGEGGLFGHEEGETIEPAVKVARSQGIDVTGPIAADTLFSRALGGEFDVVVAMYHDQGHVALKTIGFDRAVNITLGLPIVRTSVAHGTAFDIAWTNRARNSSLIEAVRVAVQYIAGRRALGRSPGTD